MRIKSLLDQKDDFPRIAREADTSEGYLYQLAYGHRRASPGLCRKLESATKGRTTRGELRSDIYGEAA